MKPSATYEGTRDPGVIKGPIPVTFRRLRAKAAVTFGKGPKGPQEVDLAECGPVRVAEVELRVRRLPQQEPAEPLLAAGADDEVGVGLAGRVQVLGDVLDIEDLGQLLDRGAPAGVLVQ